jgi:hypothetical protein
MATRIWPLPGTVSLQRREFCPAHLVRKVANETGAPSAIPRGMKNMFATLCSRPMATNALIGSHTASALPGRLAADAACHTAMQTSQLASTPRTNACVRDAAQPALE